MDGKLKGFPGLYRETNNKGKSRYRILINHKKKIIQEYFYFGDDITEKDAKKAAKKRWTELRERYPVLSKRKYREVVRKPTASGIAGVTKITTYSNGYEYEVWKATWTNRVGNRSSKQFSINKYGPRVAKRLAIAARKEALDKIAPE